MAVRAEGCIHSFKSYHIIKNGKRDKESNFTSPTSKYQESGQKWKLVFGRIGRHSRNKIGVLGKISAIKIHFFHKNKN